MKNVFILISILFIISCSMYSTPSITKQEIESSVEIDLKNIRNIPIIKQQKELSVGTLGPVPIEGEVQGGAKSNIVTEPVIALSLAPSMSRSSYYIQIIRALEQKGIKIHIVSGTGFASVIAILYAFGRNPSELDWLIHQYFSSGTRELRYYSSDWRNYVLKMLFSKCAEKRIEEAQKKIVIPLFDESQRVIRYYTRKKLCEIIKSGLTLFDKGDQQEIVSALPKNIFGIDGLKKAGADIIIAVSALGNDFKLDRPDGHLLGIFLKVAGQIEKEKERADLYLEVSDETMELNVWPKTIPSSQEVTQLSVQFANQVKDYIENWKDQHK